ncbi:MAG: hypothetical protein NTZ68_02960 [Candidatus Dependentiae bacterium]|nr:hypothetical protein [Candidatus Dependentiae bacterium]
MKRLVCMIISLMTVVPVHSVVFQGLDDSAVKINTFSCPAGSTGSTDCSSADANSIGLVLSDQKPLQFFNNQSYWLRQQAQVEQHAQTVLRRSGADLQTYMQGEGWVAMGSYCIFISTNRILTDVVMPAVKASADQVKVVVQLWYNGENLIQLWSQDAAVMPKTQGFKVVVSSAQDAQISTLPKLSDETNFLDKIGLQINNRTVQYGKAKNSPRSVKIQPV